MEVNYLSNLFQKEMALATERIFAGVRAHDEREVMVTAAGLG
jgi:hypothetical protein